jgi:site-specific DNA-cytosine methylase
LTVAVGSARAVAVVAPASQKTFLDRAAPQIATIEVKQIEREICQSLGIAAGKASVKPSRWITPGHRERRSRRGWPAIGARRRGRDARQVWLGDWEDETPMLRMLQVSELRRAIGFGDDYVLDAVKQRRDRIKILGNGVPPPVMQAIVETLTAD